MINIDTITKIYFYNSLEVPYELKKGGFINIKPILVKDYPLYEICEGMLQINKNEVNDIEIIQMSYLEFLFKNILNTNEAYKQQFVTLINLCLGYSQISFEKDKGKISLVLYEKNANGDFIVSKVISHKEFDDIKKIILYQNNPKYDDRYVNPEVKELMNQYYKSKYNSLYSPTLEEKKAFVSSKIGKSFKELGEIPYREFELIYNANVNSEIYIGQKIIQGSFKYEVKEDIKHPLFEPKKDPYAEIFEDTSVLSNKGISGAEKLNAMNLQ